MAQKRSSGQERLPLMDDLNDLIEKERTLLSLKLLAQKTETENWKAKYDLLLDKIGTVNLEEEVDSSQPFEMAAEVEFFTQKKEPTSYDDLQQLLINRASSWALDLHGISLDKLSFSKLVKEIFGSRSSFDTINLVNLEKCNLSDEYIPSLLSMIRSSRLQAIDLSNNEFSEVLFLQLLTTLQVINKEYATF